MIKPLSSFALGSAILLGASIAGAQQPGSAAQSPNCPPGSWFCAETNAQPAAPAGQPVQPLQPLPPPQAPQAAPPPPPPYGAPPPPVVVYQPPPPVMVVRPMHPEGPPPVYVYTPREAPRRHEWGLTLKVEGAMLGSRNSSTTSGMGGMGFGLRYKPVPALGLEGDVDFFGGRDYNGFRRTETSFTFNGLVFVNPRSKAQLYFLAGFGWSGAHAVDDTFGYDRNSASYTYFGGQLGVGLEWRVARHFALNADLRGFVRGRIDSASQYQPEYFDPATGRSTNTSGGGLLTGGMTFYF